MVTVVQLTSGESILTNRYVDNGDSSSLQQPLVCIVENDQLKMFPWPRFAATPVSVIELPKASIVLAVEAEDLVTNQYETLTTQWFGETNE